MALMIRYLLLIILAVCSTSAYSATITATPDIYGGTNLSTDIFASSYNWYKDGILFATTTTPSASDLRPTKNYKYTATTANPIIVNGVEAAVVGDMSTSLALDATVTDNGTAAGGFRTGRTGSLMTGTPQILWSKAWTTSGNHTINVSNAIQNRGVWVSDRNVAPGTPVYYEVLANGTRVGTTATPKVDRAALFDLWSNQVIQWYSAHGYSTWSANHELFTGIAALYKATGKAALIQCAIAQIQGMLTTANPDGFNGLTNLTSQPGRLPSYLYQAHKLYGKPTFPTVVRSDDSFCKIADRMVNALMHWETRTASTSATRDARYPRAVNSYPGVLNHYTARDSGGIYRRYLPVGENDDNTNGCGNSFSNAALSMFMAYTEPDSQWYHNDTPSSVSGYSLYQLAKQCADYGLVMLRNDGGIGYYDGEIEADYNYGLYQAGHYLAINSLTGLYGSESTLIAQWHTRYGFAEPQVMDMFIYPYTSRAQQLSILVACHQYLGHTVPQEYVDVMYSHACGGNDLSSSWGVRSYTSDYYPAGKPKVNAMTDLSDPQDQIIYLSWVLFRGHNLMLDLDIPKSVWAYDNTITAKYTATMRASFR